MNINAYKEWVATVLTSIEDTKDLFAKIKDIRMNMNEDTVDLEINDLHDQIKNLMSKMSIITNNLKKISNVTNVLCQEYNHSLMELIKSYQHYLDIDMNQSIMTKEVTFNLKSITFNADNSAILHLDEIPAAQITNVSIKDTYIPENIKYISSLNAINSDNLFGEYTDVINNALSELNTEFTSFIVSDAGETLSTISQAFEDFYSVKGYLIKLIDVITAIDENVSAIANNLTALNSVEFKF